MWTFNDFGPIIKLKVQENLDLRFFLNQDSTVIKEVCNRGVACSLLKLGSLEKTVIALWFVLSLVVSTASHTTYYNQGVNFSIELSWLL